MFSFCKTALLSIFVWFFSGLKGLWRAFFGQGVSSTQTTLTDERKFIHKFELKFGNNHPKFFDGTFKQVIDQSKLSYKPVLVYIHSDEHQNTNKFVNNVITKDGFIQYIDENFLFYAIDVNSTSGYVLANKFITTTYPFLSVLYISNNKMQIIKRLEGELFDLDTLTVSLIEAHDTASAELLVKRDEERNINLSRLQREEQDKAFQDVLEKDRKLEEERKKKELEEQLLKKKQEEEKERKEKMLKESQENKIIFKKMFEKEDLGEGTTRIGFKFPDGTQIQRRFKKDDKVEILFQFIHSLDEESKTWYPKPTSTMDNYELKCGYPSKLLDRNKTIAESQCGNQIIYVRDTNEEEE